VAGLGAVWPGSPAAQNQEIAVPEVPQLLGFDMAELVLPDVSGQAFSTTVQLNGQPYRLDLQPHTLRAPDFQLLVDHGDGQLHPVAPVPPATYRGTVQGVPDSRVAASLIDGKLWATISLDEETIWEVEPLSELAGPAAPEGFHAVYRDTDTVPLENLWCGTTDDMRVPRDGGEGGGNGGGAAGDGGIAGVTQRILEYAADADVEFWVKNGSNEQNTMLDIELIVNGMESIYEAQLNLVFEITTIVVRTGSTGSDPYSSSDCGVLLSQFTSAWTSSPESSIRRDAAQLYTGKNISFPDGCLGIAWVGSVCNFSNHYGVVESRDSSLNLTLRRALSAHELGHSLDALHCCGGCSGCPGCRIMCPCIALCSGIMTSFGTAAVDDMTAFMNSIGCLGTLGPTMEVPFFDDFPSNPPDTNKWSYNDGGFITSVATNEPSPPNSLNLDSNGSGTYQDNEIRSNFLNLLDLDDAGVFVSYYTQHKNVDADETLYLEYWAGSTWSELNAIVSDGVDETDFTLWVHDLTGLFPSPFRSDCTSTTCSSGSSRRRTTTTARTPRRSWAPRPRSARSGRRPTAPPRRAAAAPAGTSRTTCGSSTPPSASASRRSASATTLILTPGWRFTTTPRAPCSTPWTAAMTPWAAGRRRKCSCSWSRDCSTSSASAPAMRPPKARARSRSRASRLLCRARGTAAIPRTVR
jgi:hypothetical protein